MTDGLRGEAYGPIVFIPPGAARPHPRIFAENAPLVVIGALRDGDVHPSKWE